MIFIVFVLFPILGIPIYLLYYLFDRNKSGIIYSLLLGLSLGLLSYYFIPPQNYDLYRHQLILEQLMNVNFSEFLSLRKVINLESLPLLYTYLISFTGNFSFLQFFIVSLGYSILFYILYDYRKKINLDTLSFIGVLIFTIFGFHALYFISGLYYYIGIIIFFLAIYLDYIKKVKKIIPYTLYFITLFIHDTLFFPVSILIIYKIFHNKLNYKSLSLCLFIFIFALYIVEFLNKTFNISFIYNIYKLYNSYTLHNASYIRLYDGTVLFIEIAKLIITILCIYLQRERRKFSDINGFILLFSICSIIMITKSRVMVRFISLIQFIGVIPMMDLLKNNKKMKLIYLFFIYLFGAMFIIYFLALFRNQNFGNLKLMFYKNIFTYIKGGWIR